MGLTERQCGDNQGGTLAQLVKNSYLCTRKPHEADIWQPSGQAESPLVHLPFLSADSAVFLPFVPGTKILPEITNALLTEQSMPVYTFSILTYLQMIWTLTSFYAARPKNISVVFRKKMIL